MNKSTGIVLYAKDYHAQARLREFCDTVNTSLIPLILNLGLDPYPPSVIRYAANINALKADFLAQIDRWNRAQPVPPAVKEANRQAAERQWEALLEQSSYNSKRQQPLPDDLHRFVKEDWNPRGITFDPEEVKEAFTVYLAPEHLSAYRRHQAAARALTEFFQYRDVYNWIDIAQHFDLKRDAEGQTSILINPTTNYALFVHPAENTERKDQEHSPVVVDMVEAATATSDHDGKQDDHPDEPPQPQPQPQEATQTQVRTKYVTGLSRSYRNIVKTQPPQPVKEDRENDTKDDIPVDMVEAATAASDHDGKQDDHPADDIDHPDETPQPQEQTDTPKPSTPQPDQEGKHTANDMIFQLPDETATSTAKRGPGRPRKQV